MSRGRSILPSKNCPNVRLSGTRQDAESKDRGEEGQEVLVRKKADGPAQGNEHIAHHGDDRSDNFQQYDLAELYHADRP